MGAVKFLGFVAGALLFTYIVASFLFRDPAEEPRDPNSASVADGSDDSAVGPAKPTPLANNETEPIKSGTRPNVKPDQEVSKNSNKSGSSSPPVKQREAWVDSAGRPVARPPKDETLQQPPDSDGEQPTHVIQQFQVGTFTRFELLGLQWLNEQLRKQPDFVGISLKTEQQSKRTKIVSSQDQAVLAEFWLTPTTACFRWSYVADETLRRCQNGIRLMVIKLQGSQNQSQMLALHAVTIKSGIDLDLETGGEISTQSIPLVGEFEYPIHFSESTLEVTNLGIFAIKPTGLLNRFVLPEFALKLSVDAVYLSIEGRNIRLQTDPSPQELAQETKVMELELKALEQRLAEATTKTDDLKRRQQAYARLAELLQIKPINVDSFVKDGKLDEKGFADAIRNRTKNIATSAQSRVHELTKFVNSAKPRLARAEAGLSQLLGVRMKLRTAVSRLVDGVCVDLVWPDSAFRQGNL